MGREPKVFYDANKRENLTRFESNFHGNVFAEEKLAGGTALLFFPTLKKKTSNEARNSSLN